MIFPRALLSGITQILIGHQDRAAIMDSRNPGFGINCSCGKNFPPRIPRHWVPEGYTLEEWAESDSDERFEVIDDAHIKVRTAAQDFYDHLATEILTYVTTGTGYKLIYHEEK